MDFIKKLFHKFVNRETIVYLIFGVLTTLVSWGLYYGLRALDWDYRVCKVISWIGAVTFAYFTNKKYVFQSPSYKPSVLFPEMARFFGGRLLTGIIEYGLLWMSVDLLHQDDRIMNLIVTVIVVILNYVFSKVFIFRKEDIRGAAQTPAEETGKEALHAEEKDNI